MNFQQHDPLWTWVQSTDAGGGATWFNPIWNDDCQSPLRMSLSRLYLMFSGFIHPGLQYNISIYIYIYIYFFTYTVHNFVLLIPLKVVHLLGPFCQTASHPHSLPWFALEVWGGQLGLVLQCAVALPDAVRISRGVPGLQGPGRWARRKQKWGTWWFHETWSRYKLVTMCIYIYICVCVRVCVVYVSIYSGIFIYLFIYMCVCLCLYINRHAAWCF